MELLVLAASHIWSRRTSNSNWTNWNVRGTGQRLLAATIDILDFNPSLTFAVLTAQCSTTNEYRHGRKRHSTWNDEVVMMEKPMLNAE